MTYIIGIDLGTTNCTLAYSKADVENAEIEQFAIPQIISAGTEGENLSLPSFIYFPLKEELKGKKNGITWDPESNHCIGIHARDRGAEVSTRLISSAKSWLCHSGIDRRAALLPISDDQEAEKLSPLQSCAALLKHLKDAWDSKMPKHKFQNKDLNAQNLINRQILFQYYQKFPSLTEKEINAELSTILASLSRFESFPISKDYKNSHIENCIKKLRTIYIEPYLQKIIDPSQFKKTKEFPTNTALTDLVKATALKLSLISAENPKIEWGKVTWAGHSPLFEGVINRQIVCKFNVLNLRLEVSGETVSQLPLDVANNPIYKELFGSYIPSKVQTSGLNKFYFEDSTRLQVRLEKDQYGLKIQRQLIKNGPFYEFIHRIVVIFSGHR